MTNEGMTTNASMFGRSESLIANDPMEEIFALNLGDFLTEHLISEELAEKIGNSIHDKVEGMKNQLKELISIYSLDNTLSLLGFNSEDDFVIYNSIAKTIKQMLDIDACHIFLTSENAKYYNENEKLLLVGTTISELDNSKYKNVSFDLRNDKSVHTMAFYDRKTYLHKNVKENPKWKAIPELCEDETVTFLTVPMASKCEDVGLICLESNSEKDIPQAYIELIEITAKLFVTSMNLQKLVEETQDILEDSNVTNTELRHLRTELTALIGDLGSEQQIFVENLAKAVDVKGQYNSSHSQKAADVSKEICKYLQLNEKTTDLIYYAGLLQNIGKITLPEELFTKKEKLSKEDWQKLENHPNVGVSLLMNINFLSEVIPYIHYHKERWDGRGEPEGLKGHSIPLGSRIIAVADAFTALTEERPFRSPLKNEEALEILKKEAQIKWDPIIVDALGYIYSN